MKPWDSQRAKSSWGLMTAERWAAIHVVVMPGDDVIIARFLPSVSTVVRRGGEGRCLPGLGGPVSWFESEGGEGGSGGEGVGLLGGEGVEDGGAAPGGEAEVGGAYAVGVAFGVLDVDVAAGGGDGGVEDEAEVFVDAGAFAVVAADVGVEAGEEGFEGAFAVAGGEDDGVGGEAGAGVLLDVFEVEFDCGGGDAACGADVDAGGEDGVGPAAVQGAAVELVVDGGEGVGVDAFVELPLGADGAVAGVFGEGVEVAGVVGGEVFEAEFGVLHGGEGVGAADPVELFVAGGAVAQEVEEDFGAGLSGADDGDVAGGEEGVAVGEVVGGVDDGDAGGVGEGA